MCFRLRKIQFDFRKCGSTIWDENLSNRGITTNGVEDVLGFIDGVVLTGVIPPSDHNIKVFVIKEKGGFSPVRD